MDKRKSTYSPCNDRVLRVASKVYAKQDNNTQTELHDPEKLDKKSDASHANPSLQDENNGKVA